MRGRKPSGSRCYIQQIEANPFGICNTITSVEKDNLVVEYGSALRVGNRNKHGEKRE